MMYVDGMKGDDFNREFVLFGVMSAKGNLKKVIYCHKSGAVSECKNLCLNGILIIGLRVSSPCYYISMGQLGYLIDSNII